MAVVRRRGTRLGFRLRRLGERDGGKKGGREEGIFGLQEKKSKGGTLTITACFFFFFFFLFFRLLCFPYYNHNLETMKHQHLPPSVDDEDEKFPFSEPYQERPSCDYDYDTMVLGVLHLLSGIDLIPLYFIFLFKKDLFLRYPRTYLLSGII